jgi:hypothetical protein
MISAAKVARVGVKARYGHWPRHTYAVGTSNGGYPVRRAIETAPERFDGGGGRDRTFVDERGPNLLTDLPPAVLNWPDYAASTFNADSTAAKNIRGAGYPPDIVIGADSYWLRHWGSFWEVTQCQWQKRLDPSFDTYANNGTATYNYYARLSASEVGENMADIATTGKIKRPLLTVAGTMDALPPMDHHARAYARQVEANMDEHPVKGKGHGWGRWQREPQYRLYEVQNGSHIETYQDIYPQLQLIMPHAQKAFDLLVRHVEQRTPLPPDQCIGKGGVILDAPAATGNCTQLFVP